MPALSFSGQIYVEEKFGDQLLSSGARTAAIQDGDRVRGNSSAESLLTAATPFSDARATPLAGLKEIVATVALKDGGFLALRGVVLDVNLSYGSNIQTYLFDGAALAAAGKSLADIARVVSSAAVDHALNWEDLGFTAGGGLPQPNEIIGTARADTITGTAGNDVIRGLGGNDVLRGGAGEDAFVFGAETRNGRRETDTIRGFEVENDVLILDNTIGNSIAEVRSITNIAGGVRVTFFGEGDVINIFGTGLTVGNLNVGTFDTIF